MGWTKALAAAGVLALGASAAAQTPAEPAACDATSTFARQLKFDGVAPFAGASIHESLTRDCAAVLLYRLTPKHTPRPVRSIEERRNPPPDNRPASGPPHFYARVSTRRGLSSDENAQLLWADQKTCPALLPAVEALEKALAPKLTGEGPVRNDDLAVTVDGSMIVVWAAGQVYPINNASHRFDVSYRTNLGTPTADWAQATLESLRPCLSAATPTADPPIP